MGEASEAHLKRDYGSCKTPEIHTPKDVSIRQMVGVYFFFYKDDKLN